MVSQRRDLLQGTLDLLILTILARDAMHGYGLIQRLRELTGGVFSITPGSLPCSDWKRTAGLPASGEHRKTIGGPDSTKLQKKDESSWRERKRNGRQ
jgi:hypothetical protein